MDMSILTDFSLLGLNLSFGLCMRLSTGTDNVTNGVRMHISIFQMRLSAEAAAGLPLSRQVTAKVWAASGGALHVGGGPTAEPQCHHGPGVGPTTHHHIYCVYEDAATIIIINCADEESEAQREPGSDFFHGSDPCLRDVSSVPDATPRLQLTPGGPGSSLLCREV